MWDENLGDPILFEKRVVDILMEVASVVTLHVRPSRTACKRISGVWKKGQQGLRVSYWQKLGRSYRLVG